MSKVKFSIAFLFIALLTIVACKKEKPPVAKPNIDLVEFAIIGDSTYWNVSFSDADADIGLTESEINAQPPYNFVVKLNYRDNGTWKQEELLGNYIPFINVDNPARGVEGRIEIYRVDDASVAKDFYSDTVSWDVSIRDRENNESNTINSGTFILN